MVNPEMLILAREARAMTQSELARYTSISQATISKYENGLLTVNEMHLREIARVVAYPSALFSLPERRYSFGSSCTYHRKRQTIPVKELSVLLARLNLWRIQIARLLNGIDIETDNVFERLDIQDYDGDVERIADHVRRTWKLRPGPIANLVHVVESAGGIVIRASFGTNKIDAISQIVSGLPPIFLVNADKPGDRTRFTLAHELGHVLMHQIPTENMEDEADRFASAFLMPAQDILPDLDGLTLPKLAQLKAYWKVAIAALITRARDLGKISERQYRSLFETLGKSGYRIHEPVTIPPEEPTLIKDIIMYYQEEQGYSVADLSKVVLLQERECRREYGLGESQLRIVGSLD